MVNAQLAIAGLSGYLGELAAFEFGNAGLVDHGFGILPRSQFVVALRAFDFSLKLGDVAKVVEREGIIGIDEVCAVEEFLIIWQMLRNSSTAHTSSVPMIPSRLTTFTPMCSQV